MLQSIDTLIAFVVIMTVASLFVTILVQMFSALLNLRGKNLANALALVFQTIDPSIGDRAHQLAAKILSDPLLSDSTMTRKDKKKRPAFVPPRKDPWNFFSIGGATELASAIRSEEVFAVLRRLKERKENAGRAEVKTADGKLSQAALDLRDSGARLFDVLKAEAENPAPSHKRRRTATHPPAVALDEIEIARAKFDAWFETAQDRAGQWFQLHIRSLTIAASIVIALLLQLDAVEIFHFVSTDTAARNALVANAESVIKNADGALDGRGSLLQRIATAEGITLAGVSNLGDLEAAVAKRDGASFQPEKFQALVRQTTTEYYRDQRNTLSEMTRTVSATGFEFIPVDYWRWPAHGDWKAQLGGIVPHLPGIALFAALLTLGAPYWFNMLKNLASLRPALARVIASEDEEETKAK